MKYIGAHVSISGGVDQAPLRAAELGASAFGLFTKNQRQWQVPPLTDEMIASFKQNCISAGYKADQILPHDSYLINLANPDKEKRQKSVDAFVEEFHRVEQLGLDRLNFHPGSSLKSDRTEACKLVSLGIQEALHESTGVLAVIETTAGQGTNLGNSFEEIAMIIEGIKDSHRVGVCIDTCHIFAAGYDIRNIESYTKTMESFEKIIGFDKLLGVHLNDAKSELSSALDRHHSLGEGNIGLLAFQQIMEDPRFDKVPMILETIDSEKWKEEISLLKGYSTNGR